MGAGSQGDPMEDLFRRQVAHLAGMAPASRPVAVVLAAAWLFLAVLMFQATLTNQVLWCITWVPCFVLMAWMTLRPPDEGEVEELARSGFVRLAVLLPCCTLPSLAGFAARVAILGWDAVQASFATTPLVIAEAVQATLFMLGCTMAGVTAFRRDW